MPWKLNSPKIFTYSDFEKFKLPTIQYFFMNKHSNSVSLNVNSPASCFDHISSDSGSLIQNDGRRKQLTQNLQEKRKPIFIQDNLQMDIGLLSPELKEIRRDKKIDLIKPLTLPQLDLNSYSISLLDNKPLDLGVGLEKRFKKIADIEPLHKFVEKITPSESDSSLDSDIDVD